MNDTAIDWKALDDSVGYRAYTTAYDQVTHVTELADDEYARQCLSDCEGWLRGAIGSSAFDDACDAARNLATAGGDGVAVTFLVDNSGSTRGPSIRSMAAATAVISRELQVAGANVEVLGFTTRNWRGGQPRRDWMEAGRPENPGRLSEVRHVVYREAGPDPVGSDDIRNICTMTGNAILKENLDNEALQWASDRLLTRPEPLKVLVVLTDGVRPICDASSSVNGDLLDRHHAAVVRTIEEDGRIELAAVLIQDRFKYEEAYQPYSRLTRSGDGHLDDGPDHVLKSLASAIEGVASEIAARPAPR